MPLPPILRDRNLIHAPPDLILTGRNPEAKYPAHRIILMCISPYFQKLFQYSCNPEKETIILDENGLPKTLDCIRLDIDKPMTLTSILQYAYYGYVHLDFDFIQDLIVAADMYNIYGLIKESTFFLKSCLNPTNCIGIHLFASSYNCFDLEKFSRTFILGNFETIYRESDEFLDLTSKSSLLEIYKTHFLYVSDELSVWNSLIKWIDFDVSQRIDHFEELAGYLRFGLMEEYSLIYHVLSHPYVTNNTKIKTMIQEVLSTRRVLESCEKPAAIFLSETIKRQLAPRYPKDMIFVFGGRALDVEFVSPESVVEAYDHRAERWRQVNLEDPSGPRDHHQICVIGRQLFILGGHHGPFNVFNSCRKLDLTTRKWNEISPMREKRAFHTSAIIGNHIYVIGGYNGARRTDSVERYDIIQNQWTSCAPMNERRSGAGAAVLNGKIYVVGGFRDQNYLNTGEVYDPVTNQWSTIPSMTKPRSSPAVVAFNDKLHVIGGLTSNGLLSSGEKYDPIENKWEKMENEMLEKKCCSAAVVLDDKILIIGGWDGVGGLRTVELWCDRTKRWLLGTKLIRRRTGCAACVVQDVPNVENFAWSARDNIVQERVLNALGLNSLETTEFTHNDGDEQLNDFNQLQRANFSRAAPNDFDDIMDIDPN
ncbi:kelch-like protein 10 [Panonychus citri]|uniref:kelch-like protein 10 n=1 Tax=Panonychus citri TaxID=50023 RepID=UPI002307FF4E|nr:kelch-like protein 10 [Panonychus citri]